MKLDNLRTFINHIIKWIKQYPLSVRLISLFVRVKSGNVFAEGEIEKFNFPPTYNEHIPIGKEVSDKNDENGKLMRYKWIHLGKNYFKLVYKRHV